VHNTNALTKYADIYQCLDETTWGYGGFGEAGSGVVSRLMGKKKNKGGQTVLSTDVGRKRVRFFTHRHKLHTKPEGWTREGHCEMKRVIAMTQSLLITGTNEPYDTQNK
jgi:hypothetical protein